MFLSDELQYTGNHLWIDSDGEIAKIGMTEYPLEHWGEVLDLKFSVTEGEVFSGEDFMEIDFSEQSAAFACPLSGEILAVSEEVEESPDLLNEEPLDRWIMELRLADPSELDDLLSAEDYEHLA